MYQYSHEYVGMFNIPSPLKFDYCFYKSKRVYDAMVNLRVKMPAKAYIALSKLLGNPKMIKNAELLEFVCRKYDDITDAFTFFMGHEWIFDAYNSQKIY